MEALRPHTEVAGLPDDLIINSVRSQNTFVYGRTLNSARDHHFIIDGARDPKQEITPVEVFLSAVSACCVQWLEQLARDASVSLQRIEVTIESTRSTAQPNRFSHIDMTVEASGPDKVQLDELVQGFVQRCPLYATLASATEIRWSVRAI